MNRSRLFKPASKEKVEASKFVILLDQYATVWAGARVVRAKAFSVKVDFIHNGGNLRHFLDPEAEFYSCSYSDIVGAFETEESFHHALDIIKGSQEVYEEAISGHRDTFLAVVRLTCA